MKSYLPPQGPPPKAPPNKGSAIENLLGALKAAAMRRKGPHGPMSGKRGPRVADPDTGLRREQKGE
jgi:hypothetical protein